MKPDGCGGLKKVRGNWATVSVAPEADWLVVRLAVDKHADLNQYFCALEDYVLLYPDQKVCRMLPASNEIFTVEKYKLFLNRPYAKINLFLCIEYDFSESIRFYKRHP